MTFRNPLRSLPASAITGQLTAGQIASVNASAVTGQLTDAQLAAISAAKLTGQITGTQITDGAISTPKLAAGAVTTAALAADSVTADQLAAGAVTADSISAGAIDGQVITGADIRTAATGQRTELYGGIASVIVHPGGGGGGTRTYSGLNLYSGAPTEGTPGAINTIGDPTPGSPTQGTVWTNFASPQLGGGAPSLGFTASPTGSSVTLTTGGFAGVQTEHYIGIDATGVHVDGAHFGLVQDWTPIALAAGYTAGGGNAGTPEYRIITLFGTTWVEWRGGFIPTYSSGTLTSTTPFAAAIPTNIRPPASESRSCLAPSQIFNGFTNVRLDFLYSGTVSINGPASGVYNPQWIAFTGVRYHLA